MEKQKKFQKWPIVLLALLIVLVIGATFAWFTLILTGTKVNTIKAGSLSMVLDDEASDGILLQKAIPMSYQQGMNTIEYTFTLTNNGSMGDYTISLIDEATYTDSEGAQVTIEADKRIADTKIRYILLKDGEEAASSKSMLLSEAVDRVIDSGTIASGTTITYSLRIWIDSKAENEVMGQIFNARLQLDATQHKEVAASFETDSWETIIANVKAGNASIYTVGDTKTVDMGDLGIHTLRIANQSECASSVKSQTACGFVLEFADIVRTMPMFSYSRNWGGWPASDMRTYVNGTLFNSLPSELSNAIVDTTVYSSYGSRDSSNFVSTDKIYLLATAEIYDGAAYFSYSDTSVNLTRQLDYYAKYIGQDYSSKYAIKQYNGEDSKWFLRSADVDSDCKFFYVNTNGGAFSNIGTFGVSPAFRIA